MFTLTTRRSLGSQKDGWSALAPSRPVYQEIASLIAPVPQLTYIVRFAVDGEPIRDEDGWAVWTTVRFSGRKLTLHTELDRWLIAFRAIEAGEQVTVDVELGRPYRTDPGDRRSPTGFEVLDSYQLELGLPEPAAL